MNSALSRLAFGALLVLPWLNPRAGGPSSSVEPWLVSAICAALVYGWSAPRAVRPAVCAVLAAIAAWTLLRSGLGPETLAVAAACLLVFMMASVGSAQARTPAFVDVIASAWLVAAVVSTAISLLQYFGMADHFAPWVSNTVAGEAFSNLRQRNQFATLTAIGMASLFWLGGRAWPRWAVVACMAWLAIGNAATTSRTGLAQLLGLAALALLWPGPRRDRMSLAVAGVATYAAAAMFLPSLLEMLTGVGGHRLWERVASVDSCSSRAVLWSNVAHLVWQRPLLGWGWGDLDYAHYLTLYAGPRFCDILDNAHNLPLHIAVELGLPAALLFCAAIVAGVWRARPWQEADPARQMAWAVLAVIGLHSLLEYPLWYGQFEIAAGLALGLVATRDAMSDATGAAPRAVPAFAPLLAALAVAACAYASWDYRRVSQIYLAPESRMAAYQDDPLPAARASWLFRSQGLFAEVTITPLTANNKQWMYEKSVELLHYSPEPRIVEKVIESATMVGRTDEAVLHLARLRAAFPDAYAQWKARNAAGG